MNSTDYTLIYASKDGCRVTATDGVLTVRGNNGTVAGITVTSAEMFEAARLLTGHAAALETAQDDAKHAGAGLACDLVHDLSELDVDCHYSAARLVRSALGAVAASQYQDETIAGFAQVLTRTLQCGIAITALAAE